MSTGAPRHDLDRYVAAAGLEKLDFIKIDVDGGEPAVIGGA
jgi:FkbM family methyltransferase